MFVRVLEIAPITIIANVLVVILVRNVNSLLIQTPQFHIVMVLWQMKQMLAQDTEIAYLTVWRIFFFIFFPISIQNSFFFPQFQSKTQFFFPFTDDCLCQPGFVGAKCDVQAAVCYGVVNGPSVCSGHGNCTSNGFYLNLFFFLLV